MEIKTLEKNEKFEIENGPYLCIPNPNGVGVRYLKSSVIWFSEKGMKKLRNDPCVRVAPTANFHVRQKMRVNELNQ